MTQKLVQYFKIPGGLLLFCLTLYGLPLISACQQDADNHNHPELSSGKQLFQHHCSVCHGLEGRGNFLKGIPANRSTTKTIPEIIDKIKRQNDKNRQMPVFADMSDKEARLIANYLLQLENQ
jgi:mono/diheme cytochrome c family protein